jgi:LPS sulfotransferase NodH
VQKLLLDPRNGPDWDLPAPDAPPRTYVVASLPRSGSTLLCNLLWDCGAAGAPKEYLNPMQLRDWELRLGAPAARLRNALLVGPAVGALAGRWGWGPARVQAHLARVRARRSQGGWFGLKLHLHHLRRWAGAAPLEELLGPVRVLRIQRGDRLGQALSWARALQVSPPPASLHAAACRWWWLNVNRLLAVRPSLKSPSSTAKRLITG